jgi:predicted acyltransferase
VFPAFVFMTGVSIPLALAGDRAALDGKGLRRLLVRAGRLFLLGLILSNLYWMATPESVLFRPMGVLQRLALAFLAAAVLYKTGPRARLTMAVAILALYWPVTWRRSRTARPTCSSPAPTSSAGSTAPVLGAHTYVKGPLGYDPEGLLSTLPAIAQALIGVAAGEHGCWPGAGAKGLLIAGVLLIAGGMAWGLVFPISKEMWTSSFVLLSTGDRPGAGGLHQALDVKLWRVPGRAS